MTYRARTVLIVLGSIVALGTLAATDASASGTGLWVTQQDNSSSYDAAALTIGPTDDDLSAPLFAGSGGNNSFGIALTPNSDYAYVANSNSNTISEYSVSPANGALTPLDPANVVSNFGGTNGNPQDVIVDPTGHFVYVSNEGTGSVDELAIDQSTGTLTLENEYTGLNYTEGLALSPDGNYLYVAERFSAVIAQFSVDPSTGALTPLSPATVTVPTTGATVCSGQSPPAEPNQITTVTLDGTSYAYVSDDAYGEVPYFTIGSDGTLTPQTQGTQTCDYPAGILIDTNTTPNPTMYVAAANGYVDKFSVAQNTGNPASLVQYTASDSNYELALAPDGGELYVGSDSGASGGINLFAVAGDGSLTFDRLDSVDGSPSALVVQVLPAAKPATPGGPSGSTPAPSGVPGPILTQSTDVAVVRGQVSVKIPGASAFELLSSAQNIPMGSTIDATHGTVAITVALPNGTTETGDFYDGEFVVTQAANGRVFETLAGSSFAGCPTSASLKHHKKGVLAREFPFGFDGLTAFAAASKKKPTTVVRQLWGNAHGDFTTKGRYGSAAVSGTIWLTQDRCDGSYFKVTKDTIVVTAFAHPSKKHNLKQGQSILVPKP
jgi:6-phosphogluconolactonase (cycloisomerase 2 family)